MAGLTPRAQRKCSELHTWNQGDWVWILVLPFSSWVASNSLHPSEPQSPYLLNGGNANFIGWWQGSNKWMWEHIWNCVSFIKCSINIRSPPLSLCLFFPPSFLSLTLPPHAWNSIEQNFSQEQSKFLKLREVAEDGDRTHEERERGKNT